MKNSVHPLGLQPIKKCNLLEIIKSGSISFSVIHLRKSIHELRILKILIFMPPNIVFELSVCASVRPNPWPPF